MPQLIFVEIPAAVMPGITPRGNNNQKNSSIDNGNNNQPNQLDAGGGENQPDEP